MDDSQVDFWLKLSDEISINVEQALTESADDPELTSITKKGADGTPTHKIDEYAEDAAIKTIKTAGKSLILISEEIGVVNIGDGDPEVLLIMDPLDGTTNAIKQIPCYGISIAIAEVGDKSIDELTLGDIKIGYVKNFVNNDTYIGVKGRGAVKNNRKMHRSSITSLSQATVCNYIYRDYDDKIAQLISKVRRVRLIGAISIELCYVADGTYDIFLDTGNVRLLDIAASQLILRENNGIVTNSENEKLSNLLELTGTTSIIASSNRNIHDEIIRLLGR